MVQLRPERQEDLDRHRPGGDEEAVRQSRYAYRHRRGQFLPAVVERAEFHHLVPATEKWLSWCRKIKAQYTPKPSDYPVSRDQDQRLPFHPPALHPTDQWRHHRVRRCDRRTDFIQYQIAALKRRQHEASVSNSGAASMGHDIPAAIMERPWRRRGAE